MVLYEFTPTRSLRPRWVLQELEVPFEAVNVDLLEGEQRAADFLKLNPAGQVPVLVDGEVVLSESVAIALYLAEKYPDKHLLPADPTHKAQVYKWLLFTTTALEQPLWRMAKHSTLYPQEKRIPAEINLAREDFLAIAGVADQHLSTREYLVGGALTVADLILAYTLDWAHAAGVLGTFKHLQAYMERMYRRPSAPIRISEALRRVGNDPS
ncbi:MAG: glutathione S-transferase family protein [Proteobacteria bacterium]|nr:glutathione S-transferase family protein [Pseudomonadota bacterium]